MAHFGSKKDADDWFKYPKLETEKESYPTAIYTITTLCNKVNYRCIGYVWNEEDAIKEVKNNSCDMHEGNYTYCVIEKIQPGFYDYPRKMIWFEWDYKKGEYFKIDLPPEQFSDVGGFSIG